VNASSSTTQHASGNPAGIVLGLIMAVASAIIPNLDSGSASEAPLTPAVAAEAPQEPTIAGVETLLSTLEVAAEGPREGYSREAFRHWVDADGDGCDTREEVLIEESLVPMTTEETGCTISAGEWFSPYDALSFVAPGGLDIDHVVPLGEAWDSGASEWDSARRQDYANDLEDPEALIAVSASSNRSKSDRDPAEWKPPSVEDWCRYASDWVTVKVEWGLSADEAEIQALQEMLITCTGES
jgi:uncharacterized protein DUF1524